MLLFRGFDILILFIFVLTFSCSRQYNKYELTYQSFDQAFGAIANDGKSDNQAFQRALASNIDTIKLVKNGVYNISSEISKNLSTIFFVKRKIIFEGNNAVLICESNQRQINIFEIAANGVVFQNLNFESTGNKFDYQTRTKEIFNSPSSNLRAIASNKRIPIKRLHIKNCSFSNFSYPVKLSAVNGLSIDNTKLEGSATGIFCEECEQVSIKNFESLKINKYSRYHHHIYFNSCKDICLENLRITGNEDRAINIKTDVNLPDSDKLSIKGLLIEGTSGINLNSIKTARFDDININHAKDIFVLSGNIDTVYISNLDVRSSIETKLLNIYALKKPITYLQMDSLNTLGPLNIIVNHVKNFRCTNSKFMEFLSSENKNSQNFIYLKKGEASNDILFYNNQFIQSKDYLQNRIVRNDSPVNLLLEKNKFQILNKEIDQLLFTDKNAKTTLKKNEFFGIKKIKLPISMGKVELEESHQFKKSNN